MTRAILDPPPFESVDAIVKQRQRRVASAPSNVSAVPISEPYDVELGAKPKATLSRQRLAKRYGTAGSTSTARGVRRRLRRSRRGQVDPTHHQARAAAAEPDAADFGKSQRKSRSISSRCSGVSSEEPPQPDHHWHCRPGVSQANSIPATILYPTSVTSEDRLHAQLFVHPSRAFAGSACGQPDWLWRSS